jgi:glycerophosphoryl diester phosphodiesterase
LLLSVKGLSMTGFACGPVIAHRGFSSREPENTAGAFEAAIAAGCDMIELDVRLSGDGAVLVLHDDRLRRYGLRGRASKRTLAELRTLDFGGWFDPSRAGTRVLTLDEALALIGDRVPVNVELKLERGDPRQAGALADAVLPMADASGCRILYTSFSREVLEVVRRRQPDASVAFLVGHNLGRQFLQGVALRLPLFKRVGYLMSEVIPRLADETVEGLHVHRTLAGPEVIAAAHEAGLSLRVYTVNEEGLAHRLLVQGADGLFSDDVTMLRRVADTVAAAG